jgi:type I restriction enzyme S subunit
MKKGWQTKKLGDVCDFEGGSQPPKSEFIYDEKPGYVRFLQIRDFGSDKNITYIRHSKKNRLCDENDILIGRYGASVGKILTGKAGSYNVALMKTLPNLEVLDQSWFYHFLISDEFQKPLLNVADRSAQAGFSKDDIYNFPVTLPPLPEQQRIVGLLDEAFEGLATAKASAEKNLQNARALFESHLQSVFTQRGPGWVEKRIEEWCDSVMDCVNKTAPVIEEPTPFKMIRTTNVRNGRVDVSTVRFVTEETYKIWTRRQTPQKGDVILTREAPMGEVGMLLTDDKVFLGQRLVSYRANSSKLDNHFLLFALQSGDLQGQIHAKASGSTVQHMRVPDTKNLLLAAPPLTEQREVVSQLVSLREETQRLARLYERKHAALEALKKSLLHQAFTGAL